MRIDRTSADTTVVGAKIPLKDEANGRSRKFLTRATLAFFGVAIVASLLSPDWLLVGVALLSVPVLFRLLWRDQEPPALLFACGMQWLQACAALFYVNLSGGTLDEMFGSPELRVATWLSLAGVVVLAGGMRVALIGMAHSHHERADREIRNVSVPATCVVYLIVFALLGLIRLLALSVPAVAQILLATMCVKWLLVYVIAYAVLQQRQGYPVLIAVVVLEFGVGVTGYFSGFKSVFFLLVVVMLGTREAFRRVRVMAMGVVAGGLLVCGIVWSGVKAEYRDFLSDGSGQQVIVVPVGERLEKLWDLVSGLRVGELSSGLEGLVSRVSYVEYFAHTIMNVPANVPHENGNLWRGAVEHVLKPRLLFPDKSPIHDSERTRLYTGLYVAGEEQGASISIGYMAESYVDFGYYGMFVPVFLLGALYGCIYRFFIAGCRSKVLGFAAASVILVFGAYNLETSNIKLVGGNLVAVIVVAAFLYFAGPTLSRVLRLSETE